MSVSVAATMSTSASVVDKMIDRLNELLNDIDAPIAAMNAARAAGDDDAWSAAYNEYFTRICEYERFCEGVR